MPVLEKNYSGTAKSPDGKEITLPGAQALYIEGPTLEVVIGLPKILQATYTKQKKTIPLPIRGTALIDTGATCTAVEETVCLRLGLSPVGIVKMCHAGGTADRNCFPIGYHFIELQGTPWINAPRVMSAQLGGEKAKYILLVGRDILQHFRLTYNGPRGRMELAI